MEMLAAAGPLVGIAVFTALGWASGSPDMRLVYASGGAVLGVVAGSVWRRAMIPTLAEATYSTPEQLEKLRQQLAQRVAAHGDDRDSILALASTLDRLGRNPEALPMLREAVERWPDDAMLLNQLGWAMVDVNPTSDSVLAVLDRAKAAGAPGAFVADTLAWCRFLQGDYDGAWVTLRPVAKSLGKDNPEIAYHAAEICMRRQDYRAARRYATYAVRLARQKGHFHSTKAAAAVLERLSSHAAFRNERRGQ
jgi:Tfp pilus assembly protein PilF